MRKNNERIIQSLLDTDFYKFTMLQTIWAHYGPGKPENEEPFVQFSYIDRSPERGISHLVSPEEVSEQLEAVRDLRVTQEELDFLRSTGIFEEPFLAYLQTLTLAQPYVEKHNGRLIIETCGTWAEATLLEIYTLSIVSELFFRALVKKQGILGDPYSQGEKILEHNAALLASVPIPVSEFGTRRRPSFVWQERVLEALFFHFSKTGKRVKTSNVHLARLTGADLSGTQGHERYMVASGIYRDKDDEEGYLWSQQKAVQEWWEYYNGALSVWLTDTFGSQSFFADIDPEIVAGSLGFRQDSGTPLAYLNKLRTFLGSLAPQYLGQKKQLLFSDGLDINDVPHLATTGKDNFLIGVGIGGSLTGDLGPAFPRPNIVKKVTQVNGRPVVKLSDTPGKTSGDPQERERITRLSQQSSGKYDRREGAWR